MLVKALLLALWSGIAGVDLYIGLTHIHRPIVSGLVVGAILGDVQTGLVTGATLELVWMGAVPLAGAQPPNVVIGGIIGSAFAILANMEPTVAVGVAVPFAVAMQGIVTLIFTAFSPMMHKGDEYARNADTKGIEKITYLGTGIHFVFNAVIAFLPVYFGASAAESVVTMVPEWLIGGLEIAGGMMPAIGFAMLLNIMFKIEYIGFLISGFILVAYLGLPIQAVALIGAAIAIYDFYSKDKGDDSPTGREAHTDGI